MKTLINSSCKNPNTEIKYIKNIDVYYSNPLRVNIVVITFKSWYKYYKKKCLDVSYTPSKYENEIVIFTN